MSTLLHPNGLTFQDVLLRLQQFWADQGCVIQQPFDVEKGASTMNPATFLRVLGPEPWNLANVDPCRRPTDGRYGQNPNRLQHYFQFQVIMKPSPSNIQELYLETRSNLNDINRRIEELRKVEEGKSALRIKKELLKQKTRRDYEDRHAQAERAITLFNENSQALYDAPGTLAIDVDRNGLQFKVDIPRGQSEGISKMKIFCYDLMLAQLWSQNVPSPNVLIHDSTIFDGVDERQVALAIELAARESERLGFTYICTFNSDMIPSEEFSPEFDFNSFIKCTLTDDEEGNLLGMGSSRKRDKWKCVEGRNSLDNRKSLYRSTRGNIIL
jgi:hypothetical protein